MDGELGQFRILFRDCLTRMVDVDVLASGSEPGKLLGQVVALLAAFSFTFVVVIDGKYVTSARPVRELLASAQSETEFLFATTLAVAGILAVLGWNTVLPDRRDCAILGVLPVRVRTIFLARIAAFLTVVGTGIVALNAFTGLCYPFVLLPPGASAAAAARGFLAYWAGLGAMGLLVCFTVLTVQGLSALLLSHRRFVRFSTWMQLASFFSILGIYCLKPPIAFPVSSENLRGGWAPSFWFYALAEHWNGNASPLLALPAQRALWCIALAGVIAAIAFTLAFHRMMRRMMEQPDIAPRDRSRPASRILARIVAGLFSEPLDRAIILFTARTLARSRQHRLFAAAFGGVGLAIALVYAKDLLYGYSRGFWDSLGIAGDASRHWNQANVPVLAGSLVLLVFAIVGVRATFALPNQLRANWIFQVAPTAHPAKYFAAVRKALYILTAVPVWIAAALVLLVIWPVQQALAHVAVLVAAGILVVEISLYRFLKIPYACSYQPGKSNINVRIGLYALLFLTAIDRGVSLEYWAIQHALAFEALISVLIFAAAWARRRTTRFAYARGRRIEFEDVPRAEIITLRSPPLLDWADATEHFGSSRRATFGLNLAMPPEPTSFAEPAVSAGVRFEQLLYDFRYAARRLRRAPAFTAVTVLLITLGLGANLTIYSIIHSLLSKPAPGVRGTGLVVFGSSFDGQIAPGGPFTSYPNYLDLAAQTQTMSALAASIAAPFVTLSASQGTYELRGEMVSANYFETLGVPLARGRSFNREESRGSGGLAVVIAYHVWRNQFAGSENAVGQRVVVDGHPATIVGVTAEGFHGIGLAAHFEIGLPLEAFSRLQGSQSQLSDRTWRGVAIIGRLAPHVSLSQARAEYSTLSERLRTAYPSENRAWSSVPAPYTMTVFGPWSSPQAQLLMGGVMLIGLLALLLVCANVASLLLRRSVARLGDLAVRVSLGASNLRLIRMLIAEGLLLSSAACIIAWGLTRVTTRTLGALAPALESGAHMQIDLTPDGRVLVYGVALAIFATLAFTVAPAGSLWPRRISSLLKSAGHLITRRNSVFLNGLVILQVALCTLLLIAGTVACQALFSVDTTDLYFTRDHLLLAAVNTSGAAANNAQNIALLERIRERLGAIRGVVSVSYATAAPPHDDGWMDLPVETIDSSHSTVTDGTVVGPGYISTLGTPILMGRDISAADIAHGRKSAVVNLRLASELWPGASALGKSILLNGGTEPVEIVGVVPNGAFSGVTKNGAFGGVGRSIRPNFVFLADDSDFSAPGQRTLHVRYTGDWNRLISGLRAAVHDVDSRVPVFSVRTMDEEFQDFTAPIRILAMVMGTFAVSSLILAIAGLYGTIALDVTTRAREFGVRTALGGTPWQVMRDVLKRGLILTAAGSSVGLALAAGVAADAAGLFFGVDPSGKLTYLAVAVLVVTISMAACYFPARRASLADPMLALRQE